MREKIPLNLRIVALLLVWLLLVDWGLNAYLDHKLIKQQEWRINNPDLSSLQAVFDRIAGASGTVVVCLGDSEMYGSSTPPGQTIPAYLSKILHQQYPGRKITVFNLGLKGLKPAEAYFIVRHLARLPVDMLVYNVSSGWFTSTEGVKYLALIQLAGAEQEAARRGIKVPAATREEQLGEWVAQYWDFYRYRQVVSRDMLALRENIESLAERVQKPEQWRAKRRQQERLAMNWREKPELLPKGPKANLSSLNLNKQNLQWQMYLDMLEAWQQTGRPAVFYLTPANWELLEQKYQINYPVLRGDQAKLMAAARAKGIVCLDYTRLVDSRRFTDEIHLQAAGNRLVAEKLAQELANLPAARAGLAGKRE